MRARTHKHSHTHPHACMHARTHVRTHAHTYTHVDAKRNIVAIVLKDTPIQIMVEVYTGVTELFYFVLE